MALSQFVAGYLGPTNEVLARLIERCGLGGHDPAYEYERIPKAARVERVLKLSQDEDPQVGELFVRRLLEHLRAMGSFDPRSDHYPGIDKVEALRKAFERQGYELTDGGDLQVKVFGRIPVNQTPQGIHQSLERARRNTDDAPLLAGGAKELIEGVARLVHERHREGYGHDIPPLLRSAFQLAGLADPGELKDRKYPPKAERPDDFAWRNVVQVLYELGLAVNFFRNEHGTGHARLERPPISVDQALVVAEAATAVASALLLFDRPEGDAS